MQVAPVSFCQTLLFHIQWQYICSQHVSLQLYENMFQVYISSLNRSLTNSAFSVSCWVLSAGCLLATWRGVFYCIKFTEPYCNQHAMICKSLQCALVSPIAVVIHEPPLWYVYDVIGSIYYKYIISCTCYCIYKDFTRIQEGRVP